MSLLTDIEFSLKINFNDFFFYEYSSTLEFLIYLYINHIQKSSRPLLVCYLKEPLINFRSSYFILSQIYIYIYIKHFIYLSFYVISTLLFLFFLFSFFKCNQFRKGIHHKGIQFITCPKKRACASSVREEKVWCSRDKRWSLESIISFFFLLILFIIC